MAGLAEVGLLSRMDIAFSRDQRQKIYVQHRIWEARGTYAWLPMGPVSTSVVTSRHGEGRSCGADRVIADQAGKGETAATAELRRCSAPAGICATFTDGPHRRFDCPNRHVSGACRHDPIPQRRHQEGKPRSARRHRRGPGRSFTGQLAEDDTQLTKFHGIYLQDDRDLRAERAARRWRKPSASWRACGCRADS